MGSGMANRGGSPKGGTSRPGSQMLPDRGRSALGDIQTALSRSSGGMSPYPGAYGGMGGPQVPQMPPGGFSPMTGSFGAYGAMGRPQVSQMPLESYPPMQGGQGLGGYMMSRGVSPEGSARGQQPSPQGLPPGMPPELISRIEEAALIQSAISARGQQPSPQGLPPGLLAGTTRSMPPELISRIAATNMRDAEPQVQRRLDGSLAGPSRTTAELDQLASEQRDAMSDLSRLEAIEMMRQQQPAPMQTTSELNQQMAMLQSMRGAEPKVQRRRMPGKPLMRSTVRPAYNEAEFSELIRRGQPSAPNRLVQRNPYDTR